MFLYAHGALFIGTLQTLTWLKEGGKLSSCRLSAKNGGQPQRPYSNFSWISCCYTFFGHRVIRHANINTFAHLIGTTPPPQLLIWHAQPFTTGGKLQGGGEGGRGDLHLFPSPTWPPIMAAQVWWSGQGEEAFLRDTVNFFRPCWIVGIGVHQFEDSGQSRKRKISVFNVYL